MGRAEFLNRVNVRLAAQQQEGEQGRALRKEGLKAEESDGAFKHVSEFMPKIKADATPSAVTAGPWPLVPPFEMIGPATKADCACAGGGLCAGAWPSL